MPELYPSNYINKTITLSEANKKTRKTGYKQSIYYDINKGAVIRDGAHRVLTATGIEAWEQWCYNCLNTERYSCAAYPTDFGIEKEKALKAQSRDEAEAILTAEITDALMADPYKRTKFISDISFNWNSPDSCIVSITIQGVNEAEIDMMINI